MIIAVTGHQHPKMKDDKALEKLIRKTFLEVEPEKVIVGMACGTDLIAGVAAIKTCFPVIAAIPWAGHEKSDYIQKCETCREHYAFVKHFAQKVVILDKSLEYNGPQVFHARNHYMVDNATHVLAYYDGGKSGGTFATINYADKTDTPVRNLYDKIIHV